jgi:hypothetical protein
VHSTKAVTALLPGRTTARAKSGTLLPVSALSKSLFDGRVALALSTWTLLSTLAASFDFDLSGEEVATLEGHKNVVYAIAFNNPFG